MPGERNVNSADCAWCLSGPILTVGSDPKSASEHNLHTVSRQWEQRGVSNNAKGAAAGEDSYRASLHQPATAISL